MPARSCVGPGTLGLGRLGARARQGGSGRGTDRGPGRRARQGGQGLGFRV